MSSKLLINEHPLVLLPSLAVAVGLNEALMLQQIHYWLDPRMNKNYHNNRHWVYNSYQNWLLQFPFWSERTLRRVVKSLEERELLIYDFFNKTSFDKTKWYSINYDTLNNLILATPTSGQNGHIDTDPMTSSNKTSWTTDKDKVTSSIYKYTDTTTETKPDTLVTDQSIIKNMIAIWNETIPGEQTTLTKNREKHALEILNLRFNRDLNKWKEFLAIILKSDFLMGEAKNTFFKARFDWAIKEDNVCRILEGAYSNNRAKQEEPEENLIKKEEELLSNISDEVWKKICLKIKERYGPGVIHAWFRDAEWLGSVNNTFTIKAESNFKKDWLNTNYYNFIKNTIVDITKDNHIKLKMIA